MSALERYFLSKGLVVAGYDRTSCELTEELRAEGADIHYEDNPDLIPMACRDKEETLVVYTPAIPAMPPVNLDIAEVVSASTFSNASLTAATSRSSSISTSSGSTTSS